MVFSPNDNAILVATIDDRNSGTRYATELEAIERDRENDRRQREYGSLMNTRRGAVGVCG